VGGWAGLGEQGVPTVTALMVRRDKASSAPNIKRGRGLLRLGCGGQGLVMCIGWANEEREKSNTA
jgi:hypothetical protein